MLHCHFNMNISMSHSNKLKTWHSKTCQIIRWVHIFKNFIQTGILEMKLLMLVLSVVKYILLQIHQHPYWLLAIHTLLVTCILPLKTNSNCWTKKHFVSV